MKTLLLIFIAISISACEKESIDILDGTYKGTFQRDIINSDDEIANITLILDKGVFKGSSDKSNYPAICQGTYSIKQDTIIFENQCMFTADFNWTLILDGKYVITVV